MLKGMVILLPFTSSFALLATGRLVQYLALGAFVTADASLIVYLIGTALEFDSLSCVGNLSPSMGARNQVDIGLSYRPVSVCSLATQFQTRFLESIPRPIQRDLLHYACAGESSWRNCFSGPDKSRPFTMALHALIGRYREEYNFL
jgi:hypothetical protein